MVSLFRDTYPELADLLVSCNRATRSTEKTAVYGCAELVLLYPANGYFSLCIQVLNSTERNSDQHKRWRHIAEHVGCKCVTIRDLVSFADAVDEYLANTPYA